MAGLAGLVKGFRNVSTDSIYVSKEGKDVAKRKCICLVSSEKDTEKLTDVICNFDSHLTISSSDFEKLVEEDSNITLVLLCSRDEVSTVCKRLSQIRKKHPCAFIVVADKTICNHADSRMEVVDYGANMVTELENSDLQKAVDMVAELGRVTGSYECPYCHAKGFTQHDLWLHCPLYHINVSNDTLLKSIKCPVCWREASQTPMMVHIHENHGPFRRQSYGRPKLYSFSLVVCQRPSDGKFLLVQEFGSEGYFLPGGAVDHDEHLMEAAIRETKEEAGIDINLTGVLSIYYSPHGSYVRLCTVFVASPKDESQRPKTLPDFESAGAVWVSPEEIPSLQLRGEEPLVYINEKICKGATVHPLSLFERD